jgi:transcriptional regulator with XRE-family HTH domain
MHDPVKIKAARERKDLTQAAAAKRAGMTFQQWNGIEAGRTGAVRGLGWPTLERVAKALGVSARDLLRDEAALIDRVTGFTQAERAGARHLRGMKKKPAQKRKRKG